MIALDWAKAFDSLDPAGLLKALRLFGLPEKVVSLVADIYTSRRFLVRDCGVESAHYPQAFGICQGCPLSPFLFSIVKTCVMADSRRTLEDEAGREASSQLSGLLYADDTLLLGVDARALTVFLGGGSRC